MKQEHNDKDRFRCYAGRVAEVKGKGEGRSDDQYLQPDCRFLPYYKQAEYYLDGYGCRFRSQPVHDRITIDSGSKITGDGIKKETVSGGYRCTYTPTTALSDGPHTIKIDASDYDGNAAVQKSVKFTIDTVATDIVDYITVR